MSSILMTEDALSELIFKENRIKTFQNWPTSSRTSKCTIENLAQCGFIHHPTVDSLDNTICVFCMCELNNWNENDDPKLKHYRISPTCPLLCLPRDEADWTLKDVITILYEQSLNKLKTKYDAIMMNIDANVEETRKKLEKYIGMEDKQD